MSSYSVIVRKGDVFVKRWNTETRAYEEKRRENQILSDVLQYPLVLEETTFGQFFDLIAREKDLFQKVFSAAMYRHPLEPYIQEIAKPAKDAGDLDFVHVHWFAQYFEGELETSPAFGGWGPWKTEGMPEKGGIALEFTALNEYKNCLFKLDPEFEIGMLSGPKLDFKATKEFTVYDVINAILFEITWSGDISKGRKHCPVCEDEGSCAKCNGEKGEQAA
jgi:hypothetical protein